jgi:hypothetical protein
MGGNEYLVDGFPSMLSSSYSSFVPPLDEVQEVKVSTGMFDASLGRTNGGIINMTTKGGTNDCRWLFRSIVTSFPTTCGLTTNDFCGRIS